MSWGSGISINFWEIMQVHMSVPNVEQFINLLRNVPAEGCENAFVYVMSEWTKQQGELTMLYCLFCWLSILKYVQARQMYPN